MILSSWLAGLRKSNSRAPRGRSIPVTAPVEYVPIERPKRRFGLRPLKLAPCVEVFEVRTLLTTTTFTVNTTLDTVDASLGDGMALDASGNTSLRAAIQEANLLSSESVEIIIPDLMGGGTTYNLTSPGGTDLSDSTGDLDITNSSSHITIRGAGQGLVLIDAVSNGTRVFDIDAAAHNVTISDLTLRGSATGDGGAVRTLSSLTLDRVTFDSSITGGNGGALSIDTGATATIRNSMFQSNAADLSGGAIFSNGSLSILSSTFSGNSSGSDGGQLATGTNGFTTIIASTFSGDGFSNNAVNGGAISLNGGYLSLDGVTIADNGASSSGGGINVTGAATAYISRSTISGNRATATGGGIQNTTGSVTLDNVTISGNTAATTGSAGAGIHNTTGSSLDLNHVTIANNQAFEGPGGGVSNTGGGTVIVTNTIIADNTSVGSNPDVDGDFQSSYDNLVETVGTATGFNSGNGDILGANPLLLPLADNGGPTQTHALDTTPGQQSPAIDSGTAFEFFGSIPLPETDQRGVPRTIGPAPDIGAFESGFTGFIVNSTADTNDETPGDGFAADTLGNTSLRAAVQEVNVLGTGTIVVPPGFYQLAITGDDTNDYSGEVGDLDLASNATVIGFDSQVTVIDAGGISRVIQILGGLVDISSVTLQNGNAGTESGGGVLDSGQTRLINVQILNNSAADGGGVASDYNIELYASFVANNTATDNGGGVAMGDGRIVQSTIAGNVAGNDSGGVGVTGTAELIDSFVNGNTAMNDAGGVGVDLYGTLNAVNSTIAFNTAVGRAGGVGSQGTTSLVRTSISSNTAGTIGGGVAAEAGSLSIIASGVTDNFAVSSGGGIAVQDATMGFASPDVEISFSEISNNQAARGAGIDSADATLTISQSTIAENVATMDAAGLRLTSGSATIDNSTIAANTALGLGGGLLNTGGTLSLTNATIAGNDAGQAGGIASIGAASTTVANTIIAANTATASDPDVFSDSSFHSAGSNLIGLGGYGFIDGINSDRAGTAGNTLSPQLGPLQSNGGLTRTMALQPGSPALDAGNDQLASETDQRGATRQLNSQAPGSAGQVDIGAFEAGFTGFFVNTTDDTVDTNPGDGMARDASGNTSLRAAIQEANASAGDITIVLPAGEYSLDLYGQGEDSAASGDLDITTTNRLTILGAGSGVTTLDGVAQDRLLDLQLGANVDLRDVSIINGWAAGDSGGGIRMAGAHLELTRVTLRDNVADVSGGAISDSSGLASLIITDSLIEHNSADFAGAIFNSSDTLSIAGSLIRSNSAGTVGGVFVSNSDFTLIDSEISENTTTTDDAGGLRIERGGAMPHTVSIASSRISYNSAVGSGGGLQIFDETVSIVDSEIIGNSASSGNGGGIQNTSGQLMIESTRFQGNGAFGPASFGAAIDSSGTGATLTVDGSIFIYNQVSTGGGAIATDQTANVTATTFESNTAGMSGGAIYASGTVAVTNSTLSGNLAGDQGGGLFVFGGSTMVSVLNSTLTLNTAYGSGGGVQLDESLGTPAVEVKNSIIAGNTASEGADVQGNFATSGNTGNNLIGDIGVATGFSNGTNGDIVGGETSVLISDATNAFPIVITAAGHGLVTGDLVRVSGVMGNEAANGVFTVTVLDASTFELENSFGSGPYTPGTGEVYQLVDPRLGPLQNNTVPDDSEQMTPVTEPGPLVAPVEPVIPATHALLPDSPAVDAGNNSGAPTVDQRGISRPIDGNNDAMATVDVGAVELFHTTVSGVVFDDTNGNGILDPGEFEQYGVTVYFDTNRNGRFDSGEPNTVSGFGEQTAGAYTLTLVPPGQGTVDLIPSEHSRRTTTPSLALGDPQAISSAPGAGHRGSVSGDFNNDGNPDLAVALSGAGSVRVLTNDSTGQFTAMDYVTGGLATNDVVAGDINGDGLLDLISLNFLSGSVTILLNDASQPGRFLPQSPITFGGATLTGIASGDVNSDGFSDVVLADAGNNVLHVLVGDAFGGLSPLTSIAVPGSVSTGLVIADFDDDGHPDLATLDQSANAVIVAFNEGSGIFSTQQIGLADQPQSLVADDLNRDGLVDLAVSQTSSTGTQILRGVGNRSFTATQLLPGLAGPDLQSSDLNGDGLPELILAREFISLVTIYENQGASGYFLPGTPIPASIDVPVAEEPQSLAVGDFTGDGRGDLTVSGDLMDTVQLVPGLAHSSVAVATTGVPVTGINLGVQQLASISGTIFSDANRDGFQQSVSVNFFDDFSSGSPDFNWQNEQGDWQVSNGAYVAGTPSNNPPTYNSLPFSLTNFEAELDINNVSDGGLWIRSDLTTHSGVLLVTGGGGTGQTGLYWHIVTNGTAGAVLNPVSGLFSPGDNIHLRVVAQGDTYSVYLNGSATPATTLTDSNYYGNQFALYSNSAQAFDNISVMSLEASDSGLSGIDVYLDLNGNGRRDNYEPVTTTTGDDPATPGIDESGQYHFDDVVPGDYLVTEILPPGYSQTSPSGLSFFLRGLPSTGDAAAATELVDVDHDGILDLAVTRAPIGASGSLEIYRGDGHGGFVFIDSVTVGQGAYHLTAGDIDGNGNVDFVVTNSTDGTVSVLEFENGLLQDRTPAAVIPSLPGPASVRLVDLNGDSLPDLVVSNMAPLPGSRESVVYFPNQSTGAGSFAFGTRVDIGSDAPVVAFDLADLDLDGDLDLVTGEQTGQTSSPVRAYRNDAGSFTEAGMFDTGLDPLSLRIADFDRNGRPDIAVALPGSGGEVDVYLSHGDFSWSFGNSMLTGMNPTQMVVSDFNRDGYLDLAVTDESNGGQIAIFTNDAYGYFNSAGSFAAGPSPNGLSSSDIDGDGVPDLVVAGLVDGQNNVHILLNRPGSQQVSVSEYGAAGFVDFGITAQATLQGRKFLDRNGDGLFNGADEPLAGFTIFADLNNNGMLDPGEPSTVSGPDGVYVLAGIEAAQNVSIREVIPAGWTQTLPRTSSAISTDFLPVGDDPERVAVGDLDGDGDLDTVTVNRGTDTVSVLLFDSVAGEFVRRDFSTGGSGASDVALGDLDGDGLPDIVVSHSTVGSVSVLLNDGNGSFGMPVVVLTGEAQRVIIADFTNDTIPDVAISESSGVRILENDGNGGLSSVQMVATGVLPVGIVAADFNGDGVVDLASADSGSSQVSISLNNAGTLQAAVGVPVTSTPSGLAAGDVDGDGDMDLLVATDGPAQLLVNDGTGSFAAQALNNLYGTDVVLGDINGDGHLDAATRLDYAITFFIGNGAGTFTQSYLYESSTPLGGIAVADVDNDGRPDLAFTRQLDGGGYGDSTVGFLLNGTGSYTVNLPAGATVEDIIHLQSVDHLGFSLASDPDVSNAAGGDISTSVPHLSLPTIGAGVYEFYSFTVTNAGDKGYFDIDFGNSSTDAFDSVLYLYDADGNLLATNDDGDGDPGSSGEGSFTLDSLVEYMFPAAGIYVLGVASFSNVPLAGINGISHGPVPVGSDYTLHISLENHPLGTGVPMSPAPDDVFSGRFDFGNVPTSGNISGIKFNDLNENGLQDVGEPGLGGFTIFADLNLDGLLDVGEPSTVTAANGSWTLSNLGSLREYTIREVQQPGFIQTAPADLQFATVELSSSTPLGVAVADVNNDLRDDLIVTDEVNNQVLVYLQQTDGSYATPTAYGVGSEPLKVQAADLDKDGNIDLVIVNTLSNNVSVLLGTGSGSFVTAVNYAVQTSPEDFVLADFDNDTFLDIVTTNSDSDSLSILINDGNGAFGSANNQFVGTGTAPAGIAAGFINGDSNLDVVVTTPGQNILRVFFGTGGVGFTGPDTILLTPGSDAESVLLADLNGDSLLDVALSNFGNGTISVLLGNGSASHFGQETVYPVSTTPGTIVSGDFNGDQKPDLAVVHEDVDQFSLLLGNGDGSFQTATSYNTGAAPGSLAAADLDGDGLTDLVVTATDEGPGTIELIHSVVNGHVVQLDAGQNVTGLLFGNTALNNPPVITVPATQNTNEDNSVVFSASNSNQISISDPDAGTGELEVQLTVSNGALTLGSTAGLTFLGASSDLVSSSVKIANGTGGGPTLENYDFLGSSVANIGDLDGDGVTDLAVGADGTGGTNSGAVYVLFMNADGTIKSSTQIASGMNGGPALGSGVRFGSAVTNLGDLDGDGVTDLAVGANRAGTNKGVVYVLFLNADGTVKNSTEIASSTNGGPALSNGDLFGSSVANVGDLNGDGVVDLAVGARSLGGPGAVHVLFLNADGTVKSSTKIASGMSGGPTLGSYDSFGSAVANVGDLDGDGLTDLAVGAYGDDTGGGMNSRRGAVYVLFLNADGTVKGSTKIASGTNGGPTLSDGDLFGTSAAGVGDLNGDGVPDLAVGAKRDRTGGGPASYVGAVHVLLLNADGTVKSSTKIASGTSGGPTLVGDNYFGSSVTAVGDLNGDGVTDLAVGASYDSTGDIYNGGGKGGAVHVLFLNKTGTGSDLRFRGSQADVNAALDGLSYSPNAEFNGSDSLSISVSDLGNSGAGGPNSVTDSVAINVAAVNDAPTITVPGDQTITEDSQLAFSSAGGNEIVVSDVDAGTQAVSVSLLVANGTLSLSQTTGLTFDVGDGTSDASMQFTGTLTDINAALDGLQYLPNLNFNGSDSLSIAASDHGNTGSGGNMLASNAVTITVNAVNDGPVISTPPSQFVDEDSTLAFSMAGGNLISISDVDAGNALLELQLTVSDGVLTLSGTAGLTFSVGDGTNDSSMTFQGSAASINAALESLTYSPGLDFNGASSLTLLINDLGNTGSGGAKTDGAAVTIVVNAVNDAPVIQFPGGTLSYTEGDGQRVIDQSMTAVVTDVDSADFNGGSLTVTIAAGGNPAEDVVAIRDQGAGIGQIGLSGSNVLFEGTTIGTFAGGTDGNPLVISFMDTTANAASVTSLLQNITYENLNSDNPTVGDRTVLFSLADGDGGTAGVSATVSVAGINDSPQILELAGDLLSYDEGDGAVVIDQNIPALFADVDSPDLNTGTLTVSFVSGGVNAEDVLSIRNQGSGTGQVGVVDSDISFGGLLIGSFVGGSNGDSLVITLNGSATPAAATALLQNITYENIDNDTPTSGLRTIRFSGTDGDGGTTNNADITVEVRALNDVPIVVVPGPQSVMQDSVLTINGITVSDADAGSANVMATLAVSNGVLTVNSSAIGGVPSARITGNGTATVTLLGTVSEISATFGAGVTYLNAMGFSGFDSLTVTVNDLTNTGDGPPAGQTASQTVDINVTTNLSPVLSGIEGAPLTFTENDAPLPVTQALTVSDSDSPLLSGATVAISANYQSGQDVLTVDTTGTEISLVGFDTLSGVLTLAGNDSSAAYQQVLRTVRYQNTSELPTTATRIVSFSVTDGFSSSPAATRSINVVSVPDAPVFDGGQPVSVTIDENRSDVMPIFTVAVSDVDSNANDLTYAITAGNTGNAFAISSGGEITINNPAAIDFETTPTFTLTVQATDETLNSATQTFTINLNDLPEIFVISPAVFVAGRVTLVRDGGLLRAVDDSGEDLVPPVAVANVLSIDVTGRDNASDELRVDFSGGVPLPAGVINYDGGTGTGSDSLSLVDGAAVLVSHSFTDEHSGSVRVDGFTIAYTGLEPIVDNLNAADRVFAFGDGDDSIQLLDDGTAGNGIARLQSASSETVDFRVPSSSLTIVTGDGNNTVSLLTVDSQYSVPQTIVQGGAGQDLLDTSAFARDGQPVASGTRLLGSGGSDTLIGGNGNDSLDGGTGNDELFGGAGTNTLNGGAGDDLLTHLLFQGTDQAQGSTGNDTLILQFDVRFGATAQAATYAFTSAENGTITGQALELGETVSDSLSFTGINEIRDGFGAAQTRVDYSSLTSALTLNLMQTGSQTFPDETRLVSPGLTSLILQMVPGHLEVLGSTASDQFSVVSLPAGFDAGLTFDGRAGNDAFFIAAGLPAGGLDGDLDVTAESIQLNGDIDAGSNTIRLNGSVTFTDPTTLTASLVDFVQSVQLATGNPLAVNGAIDVGGAQLQLIDSLQPTPGDAKLILNNDGTDPVSGMFAGLPEGAVVTATIPANNGGGTRKFILSYTGGDGNDIVLLPTSSLSGIVWDDLNKDGIRQIGESGEPGIAGVTVRARLALTSQILATATTASDGTYVLSGLPAADVVVEFDPPVGDRFTLRDVGTDDTVDSDAFRLTGRTNAISLQTGDQISSVDAGLAPVLVSILDPQPINEGQSGDVTMLTFEIQLDGRSPRPVTVTAQAFAGNNGQSFATATLGTDFQQFTGGSVAVTFQPGQTSQFVSLPVLGDGTIEPDEAFEVRLSNAVNGTINDSVALAVIRNDDFQTRTVELVPNPTVTERNFPDRPNLEYQVRLLGAPSNQDILVSYQTAPGTAPIGVVEATPGTSATSPDADYLSASGTVRILAGQTSAIIRVSVLGDNNIEPNEVVPLRLTGVSSLAGIPVQLGAVTSTLGTIINDDVAMPTVSIGDAQVVEKNEPFLPTMKFPVTLDGPSTQTVSIQFSSVILQGTGTATAYVDYTPRFNGVLSIPAGQVNGFIEIPVFGDQDIEPDEVMAVEILSVTNGLIGESLGVGTIINDDFATPQVGFSGNVSVNEGRRNEFRQMQFQVSLNGPAATDVTVVVSTVNPGTSTGSLTATPAMLATGGSVTPTGGDFLSFSQRKVVIPRGQTSATVAVDIVGDEMPESDEQLRLRIDRVEGNVTLDPARTQATGTILNDDRPSAVVTVDPETTVRETDDPKTSVAEFTVRLDTVANETVTVGYRTIDVSGMGLATPGVDFVPVGATPGTEGTIVFAPGEIEKKIRIVVIGDRLQEDPEDFFIELTSVRGENDAGRAVDSSTGLIINPAATLDPFQSQAKATILDNDNGQATVSIQSTASVLEPDAPAVSPVTLTVSLDSALDHDVVVAWSTRSSSLPGDATLDVDYQSVAAGTVTIPAGRTSATVSVGIIGDNLQEGDEQFLVMLDSVISGAADISRTDQQGQVTIVDNDFERPVVQISDAEVIEGDPGDDVDLVFTIQLAGPVPDRQVSVELETDRLADEISGLALTDGDNRDVFATRRILYFDPNVTTQEFRVRVVPDNRFEADELVFVRLFNADGVDLADGANQAVGRILNDDSPVPTLSIASAMMLEGDTPGQNVLEFEVTLDADPQQSGGQTVTVDYSTLDFTALAGSDYQPVSGTLTFSGTTRTQTIQVPIIGDTVDERTEEFVVQLSSPVNATLDPAAFQGSGVIENDDSPAIQLRIDAVTQREGSDGTTDFVFTVTRVGQPTSNVTVDYSTQAGTALAGLDFVSQSGRLTFTPGGVATQQITVKVVGDSLPEDETKSFFVSLANPTGATVDPATPQGTGTILDDDVRVFREDADQELMRIARQIQDLIDQVGNNPGNQELIDLITLLSREVLRQLNLDAGLVFITDPVDFLLTDVSSRTVGYTNSSGEVTEVAKAYYSGDAAVELVVIPGAESGVYGLQLTGVGSGAYRTAATLVTAEGFATTQTTGGVLNGDFELALNLTSTPVANLQNSVFAQLAGAAGNAVAQQLLNNQTNSQLAAAEDARLAFENLLAEFRDSAIIDGRAQPFGGIFGQVLRSVTDFGSQLSRSVADELHELFGDPADELQPRGIRNPANAENNTPPNTLDTFWRSLGRTLLGTPGNLLNLSDFFDLTGSNEEAGEAQNGDAAENGQQQNGQNNGANDGAAAPNNGQAQPNENDQAALMPERYRRLRYWPDGRFAQLDDGKSSPWAQPRQTKPPTQEPARAPGVRSVPQTAVRDAQDTGTASQEGA
ncbi:hypothetical protein GC176_16180 [bacterium]|nr:hypothetical protein [bacterium]